MKVFVVMAFAPEFQDIYSKIIKPTFEAESFLVQRADDMGANQYSIMRDVVHGIIEANLIVAELTTTNANVLYELGMAHGLNKPTVMIAQNIEDVPSDLRPYRFIPYSTHYLEMDALKSKLREIAIEVKERCFVSGNPITDFGAEYPAVVTISTIPQDNGLSDLSNESSLGAGMWDFAALGESAFIQISNSAQKWTDLIIKFQGRIVAHTVEIDALNASNIPGNASRIHKITNVVALETKKFARGIQEEFSIFHEAWEKVNSSIEGMLSISVAKNEEDRNAAVTLMNMIETLQNTIGGTIISIGPFKESIGTWKGASRDLNHAVESTETILGQLLEELAIGEAYCDRMINLIYEYLKGSRDLASSSN